MSKYIEIKINDSNTATATGCKLKTFPWPAGKTPTAWKREAAAAVFTYVSEGLVKNTIPLNLFETFKNNVSVKGFFGAPTAKQELVDDDANTLCDKLFKKTTFQSFTRTRLQQRNKDIKVWEKDKEQNPVDGEYQHTTLTVNTPSGCSGKLNLNVTIEFELPKALEGPKDVLSYILPTDGENYEFRLIEIPYFLKDFIIKGGGDHVNIGMTTITKVWLPSDENEKFYQNFELRPIYATVNIRGGTPKIKVRDYLVHDTPGKQGALSAAKPLYNNQINKKNPFIVKKNFYNFIENPSITFQLLLNVDEPGRHNLFDIYNYATLNEERINIKKITIDAKKFGADPEGLKKENNNYFGTQGKGEKCNLVRES